MLGVRGQSDDVYPCRGVLHLTCMHGCRINGLVTCNGVRDGGGKSVISRKGILG